MIFSNAIKIVVDKRMHVLISRKNCIFLKDMLKCLLFHELRWQSQNVKSKETELNTNLKD